MYCRYCGKQIKDEAKFCPYCGKKIRGNVKDFDEGKGGKEKNKGQLLKDKNNKEGKRRHRLIMVATILLFIFVLSGVFFIVSRRSGTESPSDARVSSILPGNILDIQVNNEEDAMKALDSMGFYFGYEQAAELFESGYSQKTDLFTVYHFSQVYHELPVVGHSINVIVDDDGSVLNFVGNYTDIIDLSVETEIDDQSAAKVIGASGDDYTAQLCIYIAEDSESAHLAWEIVYNFNKYYVDAQNGKVLDKFDLLEDFDTENMESVSLNAVGQNNDADLRYINVLYDYEENMFYMYDLNRGCKIYSTDILEDYDDLDDSLSVLSFSDISEANHAAVDAMYNIGLVYDFYENQLQHSSIDGNGVADISVIVNLEGLYSEGEVQPFTNNAGAQAVITENIGYLIFPLTDGPYESSYYQGVVAHEYTHCVQNYILGSESYSPDWGPMGEAFSDIMAVLSMAYYNGGEIDWVIDDWGNGRDIADPEDRYVTQYEYYDESKDEHDNSTILSHVAYTMNSGSLGSEYTITDYETLAKLWYNALYLMTPYSYFSDCRAAVERVAEIMVENGMLTQKQYLGVVYSFDLSGIPAVSEVYYVSDETEIQAMILDGNNNYNSVEYNDYYYIATSSDGKFTHRGNKTENSLTVADLRANDGNHFKYQVVLYDDYTDEQCFFTVVVMNGINSSTLSLKHVKEVMPTLSLITNFGSSTWISGTVKDEEGNVIPGVSVTLENRDNLGQNVTVNTDTDGKYRIFLYFESQMFTLTFEHEAVDTHYDSQKLSDDQLLEASNATDNTCVLGDTILKLYPITLEGNVYDEEGTPLEDVAITAERVEGDYWSDDATTDSNGFYSINVVGSDPYILRYSKEEYQFVENEFSASKDMLENAKNGETEKMEDVILIGGGDYLANLNLPIWDGSIAEGYAGGDGTNADPYQISNGAELALMAYDISHEINEKCYFILTADIQLNDLTDWEEWLMMPPANTFSGIGTNSYPEKCFQGVFDGQNHIIYGMYSESGMFPCFHYGVSVCNLTIDASVVYGSDRVGGLVGEINTFYVGSSEIYIQNCNFNGIISENASYAGGIAGYISADKSVNINECKNSGIINGTNAGGIVGGNGGYGNTGVTLGNVSLRWCENYGSVTGEEAGGIIGVLDSGAHISYCRNIGEITASFGCPGGIAGSVSVGAGAEASINNCTNSVKGGITGLVQVGADGILNLTYNYYYFMSSAYVKPSSPIYGKINDVNMKALDVDEFRSNGIPLYSDAEEALDTGNYVYYNGKIYYLGFYHGLFQANYDGTQERLVDRTYTDELYVYESYLCYITSDYYDMVVYDMDTGEKQVIEIDAGPLKLLNIVEGNIYYYDQSLGSAIIQQYSIRDEQRNSLDLGVQALDEFDSITIDMGDTYFAVGKKRLDDEGYYDEIYHFYTIDGIPFRTMQGEDYEGNAHMSFKDGQLVIYSDDTIWIYDPITDEFTDQISYSGVSIYYIISVDKEYLHVFDGYTLQEYKISLADGSFSEIQP